MSALELQESLAKMALTRQRVKVEREERKAGIYKPKPRRTGKIYAVEWKPEVVRPEVPWWNKR